MGLSVGAVTLLEVGGRLPVGQFLGRGRFGHEPDEVLFGFLAGLVGLLVSLLRAGLVLPARVVGGGGRRPGVDR
ncbi:hypothetical protein GCM10010195_71200 [Kitasatospora griseola]|nr:hypothetical protein GCM10010195_71200 [Kitasatospora griseola]